MSDLDKLFGDFEKRKQDEKEAQEAKSATSRKLKEDTLAILQSVVSPALKELAESINEKGHRAEVREHFETYVYPSVGIAFFPTVEGKTAHRESTIHFIHTDKGNIKVEQRVQSRDGSKPSPYSDYSTNNEWPLKTVSQEKVRERATEFIASVLKVN